MGKKTAKERQQKAASGGTVATAVPLNPTITVLTLEDGTELPVGRLEGMTDEQYMKVLEHLRNNPEIARQQAEKAQKMMITNPMMAQVTPACVLLSAPPSLPFVNCEKTQAWVAGS